MPYYKILNITLLLFCLQDSYADDKKLPLRIQLTEDQAVWKARPVDVRAVLESCGAEMTRYFPRRRIAPLSVFSKGGPITLYDRHKSGAYIIKLNTEGLLWSQYAYQFSHELCHVLCNYRKADNPNLWFEESLCEAASIFTLRAMGKTWKEKAPYPNWRDFNTNLTAYAKERMDSVALQTRRPLSVWFKQWSSKLRESGTQRELNTVVAVKLLPLLEESPSSWEAVTWLNVEESRPNDSFQDYLQRWIYYAPKRHHSFIEKVASEFGTKLD